MAIPSAVACSFDRSLARRILAMTLSGTDTPGTSFARNSAFRSDTSGQIPAITGILTCETAPRNVSSCAASKTGCVIANSAPASTFHSNRRISCAASIAAGFTPTPIANRVGCPMAFPPGSSPRLRFRTRFVRPIESMSNTAVASGYGPIFGGSPVMISRLRNPIAAAPNKSLSIPSRLRSRQA